MREIVTMNLLRAFGTEACGCIGQGNLAGLTGKVWGKSGNFVLENCRNPGYCER